MKKRLFKLTALVIAVCISAGATGAMVSAEQEREVDKEGIVFNYGQKEIVVYGANEQKAKLIADFINEDKDGGATRLNPLCILGHSTATGTATTTYHFIYTTAPRCVKDIFSTVYCTRSGCDYKVKTLISTEPSYCCT